MNATLRNILKLVVPKPLRRNIRLSRQAVRFREVYFGDKLRAIRPLLLKTGETHNFTYDLTETNLRYMAEAIAVATGKTPSEIEAFIREAINDQALRAHFDGMMASHDGQRSPENVRSPFGRRLGWYATVRASKPRTVIETGVERGHGALLLCAALLRNSQEGAPGRYFGTDIKPAAGWLLSGKYAAMGKILVGDSITTLTTFAEPIDLFINDSDHSADYEAREYETVLPRLSPAAIVLGDNAHVTDNVMAGLRVGARPFLHRPRLHGM